MVLAVSPMVPPPWNVAVAWAGFLAAALAGLSVHPPESMAGKPIIQGTALSVASGALTALSQLYGLVPAGWPQSVALSVAGVLAWLSGSALPALGSTVAAKQAEAAGADAAGAVASKQAALNVMQDGAGAQK
jgi:hypothetical protein